MYEKKRQPPLARDVFVARVLRHLLGALLLILFSLVVGIGGYMHFERLSLVDAFLDAAMLLGGMGPGPPPGRSQGGQPPRGQRAKQAWG